MTIDIGSKGACKQHRHQPEKKDGKIEMLWETRFYPIFDDLMSNQNWLSLIEKDLTWSEKSSKKSIEKIPVSKIIIVIESNSEEETEKKREIIVIDDSNEDDN